MNEKFVYLNNNGIDTSSGLSYLGDEGLYNEILLEFKNNFINQMNEIKNAYEKGDIENYAILTHALKGNCRTLGIKDLAELAYSHELKAKEKDMNYITSNITALFTKANEVYIILEKYFNN